MKENGVSIYDSEHVIQDQEGNLLLLVTLGGHLLQLKPRLVPDGTIFILDPSEAETEAACVDALYIKIARWLGNQRSAPVRILTPESSKSEQMVKKLTSKLCERVACAVNTKMFLKGNSRAELEARLGPDAYIVEYSPITHKSNHLGISQTNAQLLREEYSRGVNMMIVDDVISSEATMKGKRALLSQIFAGLDYQPEKIPAFAAARELPAGIEPADDDPYIYPLVIPVFLA